MTQATLSPSLGEILTLLTDYLESLYGEQLDKIILFGSQARGEARPDSDIDVLVVLEGPINPTDEIKRTSQFIGQLCLEKNVVISRVFATHDAYKSEASPFFLSVHREGLVL